MLIFPIFIVMNVDEINFPSGEHFGDRMSERIAGMVISDFIPGGFWGDESDEQKAEIKKSIIKDVLNTLNKRFNSLKSETFDDSIKIYYMLLRVKILKDGKLFVPNFVGTVEKEDGSDQKTQGNTFVIPVANNTARTIYIVGDDIQGSEIASKNRLKYKQFRSVEYREYHKPNENFEYIINYKNITSVPVAQGSSSQLSGNLLDSLKKLNKMDVAALDSSEIKPAFIYYKNVFASFRKNFNDAENRIYDSKMGEILARINNINKQIANPNSISANELKVGRFTELAGKGRVKVMDYDYYFPPDSKGTPSTDRFKVMVLTPIGPKTFLMSVFGNEDEMKKLKSRMKKEKTLAEVRKTIRKIISENQNFLDI